MNSKKSQTKMIGAKNAPSRDDMLVWYDEHKRDLPWRVPKPDPYRVLLSEIMLQQTTVTAVKPYYAEFLKKWPRLEDLAGANDEEVLKAWAGLGYYSRARNLLKAVREIEALGAFPRDVDKLKTLSGVGEYTSAAVAAIAFGAEILPMDGNVKRVLARVHGIDDPIDKPSARMRDAAKSWEGERSGDLAQAFMDLGAMICRPKNPACKLCPLFQSCIAFENARVDELPKRTPKRPKKAWTGHGFIVDTPRGVAFEMREKGLLGEMYGLPSVMGEAAEFDPPIKADWKCLGEIEHVFTHIHLRLCLWYVSLDGVPSSNQWVFLMRDEQEGLASLWRKALKHYEDKK